MKNASQATSIADNTAQTTAGTVGKLTLTLARLAPDAPIFGYSIVEEGKVPFIASANVYEPNHSLVIDEKYRKHVTTGYSPEQVEARARLFAAAPELLSALKLCLIRDKSLKHNVAVMAAIDKATLA